MGDEVQRRLTAAVDRLQSNLSKSHFRPMMRLVHACSIKCYDNDSTSDEQVSHCEQACAANTQAYKQVFEHEINSFQSRLQRGIMDCQDAAQDRVTEDARTNPSKMAAIQTDMDKCVSSLVDKHISMLPSLQKKIESQMDHIAKR